MCYQNVARRCAGGNKGLIQNAKPATSATTPIAPAATMPAGTERPAAWLKDVPTDDDAAAADVALDNAEDAALTKLLVRPLAALDGLAVPLLAALAALVALVAEELAVATLLLDATDSEALVEAASMEKGPVVENTSLMFPMFTASMVYAESAATIGSVI